MMKNFFRNKRSRAPDEVGRTELALSLLATIKTATSTVRQQRAELKTMRDAYEGVARQLALMANSVGFLWHKDAEGKFIFASHGWCEFFWRDSVCDVEGFTDIELATKFLKRFPEGTFTFGQDVCCGSDRFTIEKGSRCRFIECGTVITDSNDPAPYVVLQTDKTPLYNDNEEYIGIVGMAMLIDCDECKRNLPRWIKDDVVEKLSETLYYIHGKHLDKNCLPGCGGQDV